MNLKVTYKCKLCPYITSDKSQICLHLKWHLKTDEDSVIQNNYAKYIKEIRHSFNHKSIGIDPSDTDLTNVSSSNEARKAEKDSLNTIPNAGAIQPSLTEKESGIEPSNNDIANPDVINSTNATPNASSTKYNSTDPQPIKKSRHYKCKSASKEKELSLHRRIVEQLVLGMTNAGVCNPKEKLKAALKGDDALLKGIINRSEKQVAKDFTCRICNVKRRYGWKILSVRSFHICEDCYFELFETHSIHSSKIIYTPMGNKK